MDQVGRLLSDVKERARGWMPLPVYRRLYDTAAALRGGTIVEVGTYCGAATIALALGAKSSDAEFKVYTVDLLRPGVGLDGPNNVAKIEQLVSTFAHFGVADAITFIPGTSTQLIEQIDPWDIRLLLLDGGGMLEADFAQLWDRLSEDCQIVIDDIDDKVFVRRITGGATIDQKHRISHLLADRFKAAGLLIEAGTTLNTGWYRKGEVSATPTEIQLIALPAYQELIKAWVDAGELSVLRSAVRYAASTAPWLVASVRGTRARIGKDLA